MAESKGQSVEEQLAQLHEDVRGLKAGAHAACTGGMLSSRDFRTMVVHEASPNRAYQHYLELFNKREWNEDTRGHIIITPFDEYKLTPFSYDLSIGDRIVSARDLERVPMPARKVEPGETVVVLTEEFLALPDCYSATVWPRFTLVREGMFQSMVKIDPTWYGKLAVAMVNLSPRTFPLEQGMPFGTLIVYGLTSPSDIDLWEPRNLPDRATARASVKGLPGRDGIAGKLGDDFEDVAWIEGDDLRVRGMRRTTHDKMRSLDGSPVWKRAVDEVWQQCQDFRQNQNRIVGTKALGLDDLAQIAGGKSLGTSVQLDQLTVEPRDLRQAAEKHGSPFHLVYGLPGMIERRLKDTIINQIREEVGRTVYPSVVMMMLRLIGSLSLVVGLVALIIRSQAGESPEAQRLTALGIILYGVATAVILLISFVRDPLTKDSVLRRAFGWLGEAVRGAMACVSGRTRHRRKSRKELGNKRGEPGSGRGQTSDPQA